MHRCQPCRFGRHTTRAQGSESTRAGCEAARDNPSETLKKASVYVLGNGIASEGTGTNINKLPAEVDASLVGTVKEGQEVSLTSKGSDTTGKTTLAWDLKLKTKVLALKGS